MSPHHRISQSFALPPATKPVSHLPWPLPLHHRVTASLHHHATTSLRHRVTTLVSHLPCPLPPNQSVICLTPYHQTSQSFALPPTTASLCHCISQSFALPPATKPVSHLPCPLPPNQSVICLAPYHQASQPFALPPATKPVSHLPCPLPPRHRATALVSHLPCSLPPSQSVICLAPCHQTSQSFALPPTTVSPHHCITTSLPHRVTALVSHLPCLLPPSQSVICLAPCHQASQSFALPPTTTSLRHHITAPPHHRVTALVSHLPCPLPPSQSVICLAPCHQTSQSFALPPTTASPRHHITVTASPRHHVTASLH